MSGSCWLHFPEAHRPRCCSSCSFSVRTPEKVVVLLNRWTRESSGSEAGQEVMSRRRPSLFGLGRRQILSEEQRIFAHPGESLKSLCLMTSDLWRPRGRSPSNPLVVFLLVTSCGTGSEPEKKSWALLDLFEQTMKTIMLLGVLTPTFIITSTLISIRSSV